MSEFGINLYKFVIITYLPHEAAAEVSKDKEPVGRGCVEFTWFESQLMSSDLGFKRCRCELIEIQMIWMSNGLRFKRVGNFFFCETSFKNRVLKLKNEAFLGDFLQKSSFEAQKRSFPARLPSKTKLWSSKTNLFCETSFKNDMLTRHLASEFQYVLAIFN